MTHDDNISSFIVAQFIKNFNQKSISKESNSYLNSCSSVYFQLLNSIYFFIVAYSIRLFTKLKINWRFSISYGNDWIYKYNVYYKILYHNDLSIVDLSMWNSDYVTVVYSQPNQKDFLMKNILFCLNENKFDFK